MEPRLPDWDSWGFMVVGFSGTKKKLSKLN